MKAVAVLCVRNEEAHIETTLRHLIDQGVKVAVLDQESTDDTWSIISRFSSRDVIARERLRYEGVYDLHLLLRAKEALGRTLDADWIINQDADEILQSPYSGETLYDALRRIDRTHATAINFHEFVFVPTDAGEDYARRNYVREMRYYYFFQPHYPRLMRIFRPTLSNVAGAGHSLAGPDLVLYPDDFMLRHYIALSLASFRRKYGSRPYAPENVARGWHRNRVNIDVDRVTLPKPAALKEHADWQSCAFDTTSPWKYHFWEQPGSDRLTSQRRESSSTSEATDTDSTGG